MKVSEAVEREISRERNIYREKFLDDIVEMYSDIYNLFNGMTKSQIIEFLRGKRNIDKLTDRRKALLGTAKKILDNLSGHDTILPVDDLPVGEITPAHVKKVIHL